MSVVDRSCCWNCSLVHILALWLPRWLVIAFWVGIRACSISWSWVHSKVFLEFSSPGCLPGHCQTNFHSSTTTRDIWSLGIGRIVCWCWHYRLVSELDPSAGPGSTLKSFWSYPALGACLDSTAKPIFTPAPLPETFGT
jgi:hypothetical protein